MSYAIPSSGPRAARNHWLLIGGLFLMLLVASVLVAQPQVDRPYDMESAEPGGLLALTLWLEELGYRVGDIGPAAFSLNGPNGGVADLLFVYPNAEPYSDEHTAQLAEWVKRGGTLVLIGPTDREFSLIERFGVQSVQTGNFVFGQEDEQQPLLPQPPGSWSSAMSLVELDLTEAPNAVPVLANQVGGSAISRTEEGATVAVQALGDGVIWHLSTSHNLTNQALALREDGYILPALLRNVPDGGVVLFDTYHLYGSDASAADGTPGTLREWLYQTNPGRAILLASLLLFGYLLLQGRRLGPPLPHVEAEARREAAEYVVAMAGLRRRLGEPTQVASYQRRRLKQAIGKPLNIATSLPDEEFIQQWQERNPNVSQATVDEATEILVRLSLNLNERTLVETAARIDRII